MRDHLLEEKIKYLEKIADEFVFLQVQFNKLNNSIRFLEHKVNTMLNKDKQIYDENTVPETT